MKVLLLAAALLVSAQVSAKEVTCEGLQGESAVKIVLDINEAGVTTIVKASVDGTEVLSLEGEQIQSGAADLPTDDGSTVPAYVVLASDEINALVLFMVDSATAGTADGAAMLVAGDVQVEGVELVCKL